MNSIEFHQPLNTGLDEIERYGIGSATLLEVGFISDNKRDQYFSSADAVMLPYTNVYSSGVVHLAYSYGVPVIASDLPIFRDVVRQGKTGFLFPRGDVDALSRALLSAFSDQQGIRHMKSNARSEAANYDWGLLGQNTIQMYRRLLEREGYVTENRRG